MEAAVKERTESFARCEREAADMKARRDQLQNDRKELWREENGISECAHEPHYGFGLYPSRGGRVCGMLGSKQHR